MVRNRESFQLVAHANIKVKKFSGKPVFCLFSSIRKYADLEMSVTCVPVLKLSLGFEGGAQWKRWVRALHVVFGENVGECRYPLPVRFSSFSAGAGWVMGVSGSRLCSSADVAEPYPRKQVWWG